MGYRNIVVAGDVGTGTTTLAKNLANKLNWRYLSNGDIYRKYVLEHNIPLWDHSAVPDEIDKKIDNEFLKRVTNEKGFVFDTHYGGYFARNLKDIFKILLVCDSKIAEKRILSRIHTHKETIEDIRRRRKENLEKFHKLYSKDDPANPSFFDLILDTETSSPDETFKKALEAIS